MQNHNNTDIIVSDSTEINNSFIHKTEVQVRFNDVDMMGHVNNAVYQNYFDYGKVQYFNNVLGKDVDWQENGLVLAKITIEYFSPVLLDDELFIQSKISRLGTKSLHMIQELVDKNSGDIKSSGVSVMVAYSFVNRKTIPIPQNWRDVIIQYETDNAGNINLEHTDK